MIRAVLVVFAFFLAVAGCQSKEQAAEELYEESLILIEKNELAAAENKLDEALALDARNGNALTAKLELYAKQKDRQKFEKSAARLYSLDLLNDNAVKKISESLLAKGNKIEALTLLSFGRNDENNASFDRVANEIAEEGIMGHNKGFGVKDYYNLLINFYGMNSEVTSTGAALYQLLYLVDLQKNPKLSKNIIRFVSDKLSLLETNVNMETLEATASGYRLAAAYASYEFKNTKELIDGAFQMNIKTVSVQRTVSDGKVNIGSSSTREKIFFHRVISERLVEVQQSK